MLSDASVFSIQWAEFPAQLAANLTPTDLLTRYLAYIARSTVTLIRPTVASHGIEFRLAGTSLSLISFLPVELTDHTATLRICGGFLVQPRQCDRGELRFGVEAVANGMKISLQLSDFCPLLLGSSSPSLFRYWLYRLTQATIHRLVTVRFLALLYHELAGSRAKVRIVKVAVQSGTPV